MNHLDLIKKAAWLLEVIRRRQILFKREREGEKALECLKNLYDSQAAMERLIQGLSNEDRRELFKRYGCLSNLTTPFHGGVAPAFTNKPEGKARLPFLPEDSALEDYYFVGSALARRLKDAPPW